MKCYTVEYKTTNKIKEKEFNDLSKAYEFAEDLWLWEGYDYIKLYDNTRESRKVITEDWGER
jgi:oligoribonuclease NrnB/cAMP/cGMP phosphodiesterase (DHH superfamily)